MVKPAEETEGRKRGPAPNRKSLARLAAVQALYQVELAGEAPERVKREFIEHRLGEEIDGLRMSTIDRSLFSALVEGAAREAGDLDDMLTAVLPEDWPVERLERLLRIILRAGAHELCARPDTPARVIIKEYVDLAHAFFEGKEPGMANAILDRLSHVLRPEEFPEAGASAALADLV
jgi:N utilization substance protein B